MARRYRKEWVDVVANAAGEPVEFRWRGRRYVVFDVIASWVEAMPWWRGGFLAATAGGQRQVWRVEAAGGPSRGAGVYELSRDALQGCSGSDLGAWQLVRVLD